MLTYAQPYHVPTRDVLLWVPCGGLQREDREASGGEDDIMARAQALPTTTTTNNNTCASTAGGSHASGAQARQAHPAGTRSRQAGTVMRRG